MDNLKRNLCWSVALFVALTLPLHAATLKIERPKSGAQLVSDPGGPGGQCTAIDMEEERGAVILNLPATSPGLYRVALPLRLHGSFNAAPLQMRFEFGASSNAWLSFPVSPIQLDGQPGAWTVLTRPVTLSESALSNTLKITWVFAEKKPPAKKKPAPAAKTPPTADKGKTPAPETHPNMAMPLAEIDSPAILVGDPVLEPVATTLAVEKVWPEFIHVYPGGTNPVSVTVRNFSDRPADATVRLEMKTGLDESTLVGEQKVQIPGMGVATVQFPWVAGTREFGYAAVATLSVGGKAVHTSTEYFSVSDPIWKTAIQGSGFIGLYGREAQLAPHVADNRRAYINVEEAFSWQPSSWDNLNPTTEEWWSGQGNGHNSLKGLHEWIDRSHATGIKMITYSWPTISGKAGFDWGQRFPDLLCRDDTGVGGKIDVNNLRLWQVTHDRKELWPYYAGGWMYNMVNLGLLRTIDHHAQEVIRSSKTFGWDGLRFDMPPGWSAMGTNDVEREMDMLKVRDVIKQLMPDAYNTTNSSWTGQEISDRNVRYFRYIWTKQISPHFALSYNAGTLEPVPGDKIPWLTEMSKGGGQLMNEAIRYSGSISNYINVASWHTDAIRQAGGYSCLFSIGGAPLGPTYSAIFTFALGSHPYLDYGWLGAMPGEYSKFMTRYGEYCWDLALKPVTPADAGITVDSKTPLLWESYLRTRMTAEARQTVVHLITKPELDRAKSALQAQLEWPRNVVVKKICQTEPTVWLLTAEPEMTAQRLTPVRSGNTYTVTVPAIHYWTMLVWSEKP